MLWELQVDVSYSLVSLVIVVSLKRRKATAKFKAEDAQTPDIDPLVMRLLKYHLRWEIIESTAKGLPFIMGRVDTPTKVCYLDGALK